MGGRVPEWASSTRTHSWANGLERKTREAPPRSYTRIQGGRGYRRFAEGITSRAIAGVRSSTLVGNLALYLREHVIGIAADQTHGPDDDHQDHGQHHRVFGYVLPLLFRPQLTDHRYHYFTP